MGVLLERLLDVLAPPACAACDAALATSAVLCAPCASAFVPAEAMELDGLSVHAAGLYGGPLATAIQRLKFGDRSDLARPLGELLRRLALERALEADVLVPVPLHPRRLAARGYNQSALLARRLAKTLDAQVDTASLVRRADGRAQLALSRSERQANLVGAFAVTDPRALFGRRVALVDDVVTTGATAAACADALLAAGASRVTVVALARTE